MKEKHSQAKVLTKKLEKIVSLTKNTKSVEAAIEAQHELSVFDGKLDNFADKFGQDGFVDRCRSASQSVSERLEQSLAAYI